MIRVWFTLDRLERKWRLCFVPCFHTVCGAFVARSIWTCNNLKLWTAWGRKVCEMSERRDEAREREYFGMREKEREREIECLIKSQVFIQRWLDRKLLPCSLPGNAWQICCEELRGTDTGGRNLEQESLDFDAQGETRAVTAHWASYIKCTYSGVTWHNLFPSLLWVKGAVFFDTVSFAF